jgi:transposase
MSSRNKSQTPPSLDATTVGIDISRLPLFQVYGVNDHGRAAIQANFSRGQLVDYFEKMPRCTVGIAVDEAYASTARYWKKKLEELNHTVTLMATDFVRTHGQVPEEFDIDAKAICKAVQRTV